MHKFKIVPGEGLYIDNTKVECVTKLDINSSVEDISRVKIEFLAKIEGLDDLQDKNNTFNENT